MQKTGKTRSTQDQSDPGKPGRDPAFVMHKLPFAKSKLDP
jgi:hypothetical protein